MATFAVIAKHPPELCPSSNAQTRKMMNEGAGQIPQLAERLGVTIVTLRVFGPDHSSSRWSTPATSRRSGTSCSRAAWCNGTRRSIHATYSLDEALVRVNELDAIF